MTDALGYTSAAAQAWLEGIMRARLSEALRLTLEGGAWALRLEGAQSVLRLPLMYQDVTLGAADLPCAAYSGDAPLGPGLAAVGARTLPAALYTQTPGGAQFAYDVPGLIYWMLTRAEEIGREADVDKHGRFPATASHAVQHGYLERPIVDEWLILLGQAMQTLWPALGLKSHDFATTVSHDVDLPARYGYCTPALLAKRMAGDLRRGLPLGTVLRAPFLRTAQRRRLHKADPYNSFDWIMDQSDARGLKSAFYFIPEDAPGGVDPRYTFDTPPIHALIGHIAARGHEVGLHPHYGSYLNAGSISRQTGILRRVCAANGAPAPAGGRMHYLQWQMPQTPALWAAAGLHYDSSLGYAERPGFRAGTCFDYPGFDPVARAPLGLTIRPLVAMEVTVIDPIYLGLGLGQAALARFTAIKAACRAVSGRFTFLWHNDGLGAHSPAERALYTGVLDA